MAEGNPTLNCPRSDLWAVYPVISKAGHMGTLKLADTETIRFRCPHCNKPVCAARLYAEKRGKCPGCGRVVKIPAGAPDDLTPELMPAEMNALTADTPRAKKSTMDILIDELQLDRGLVIDATAKKFGYPPEQVKEGCRQVIALVDEAVRRPQTWDDLQLIIRQGAHDIWPDWVDLVIAQINAKKGRPFPQL